MKSRYLSLKFIFFICQLFSFISYSNAQSYLPLPDSNVVWIMKQDNGFAGWNTFRYLTSTNKNDTLINSKSYTKLFFNDSTTYVGAYLSDTFGKTFFVPKDSIQEYLLFDFAKNAGDSVKNVFFGFSILENLFVDSVNHISVGPYLLKRIYLKGSMTLGCNIEWIEKIGSDGGGIFNFYKSYPIQSFLNCMSYDDTIYYSNTSFLWTNVDPIYIVGICSNFPTDIQESNASSIKITPNPFSDKVTLDNIDTDVVFEIKIYNTLGQLVFYRKNFKNNYGFFSIELNDINSGIYFLIACNKDKILFTQKLLKK